MSKPLVGVVMGSRSDWETMAHAVETLEALDIAHEVRVVSAHRTPDLLFEYASTAESRGLEVPVLSRELQDRLREKLSPEAAIRNPVDMIAAAGANVLVAGSAIFNDRQSVAEATAEFQAVLPTAVTRA